MSECISGLALREDGRRLLFTYPDLGARWAHASAKGNGQMVALSQSVCSHFYWLRTLKTGLSKYSPSLL